MVSVVRVRAGEHRADFSRVRNLYRGAWNQLKVRSSNMDTLVALGSTTAYAYSVWALFSGHRVHLYFMEAASIITLISVGHWVESRVSVRASDALRKLLDLAPQTASGVIKTNSSYTPSTVGLSQNARSHSLINLLKKVERRSPPHPSLSLGEGEPYHGDWSAISRSDSIQRGFSGKFVVPMRVQFWKSRPAGIFPILEWLQNLQATWQKRKYRSLN